MKDLQRTTSDLMWWAPHFNNVETSGTLPKGTIVSIRDEDFEPHPTGAGRGHAYYLLEWEGGSGWTRTYDPDPFPPKWEPVEAAQVSGDGKEGT